MLLVAALAACGGGGDDDDTVALEDIEPIVDIDPCDLIDDDTASQLSGAEVGSAESTTAEDGTTSCEFAFADEDDADTAGSAIAASLRIGPGDEDDIPGGALARSLSIGDAAAVEEEEQKVRVVYIVREVVVRVEVAPGSGEVTPELVDEVIEFTETTEEPVTEAVTGEPFERTTTTVARTTTTVDAERPEGEEIEVDGPAVTATVDRAGGLDNFVFEARAGDIILLEMPAATRSPVDSTECLLVRVLDPADVQVSAGCAREDGSTFIDRMELEATGAYQVVFDPDGPITGSVQVQISSATDQEGTISVDGAPATLTVGDKGGQSRFAFTARAGDAIFVSLPAATRIPADSTECLLVRIVDSDAVQVSATCAREDGSAFIDRTELSTSGTHNVVFDPDGRVTGSVQVAITSA